MRLSEKKKERIDAFLKEVKQRIQKVPSVPETEVRQVAWGTARHLTQFAVLPREWGAGEIVVTATKLNQVTSHTCIHHSTTICMSCTNFIGFCLFEQGLTEPWLALNS